MKKSVLFPARGGLIAFMLLSAGIAHADKIRLKSGEIIDGTIVNETAEVVEIEYQFSPTVKDFRKVPVAEIEKIEKTPPDLVDYERISKMYPLPDLSEERQYVNLITKELEPFLKAHPDSPKAKDVKRILETATADVTKLRSGALLIRGAWVDANTLKTKADVYDAILLRHRMKESAADKKFPEALRAFEEYRKKYFFHEEFRDVMAEGKKMLADYSKNLDRWIKEYPVLSSRREAALRNSQESDDARVTAEAITRETEAFKALVEQEKKDGVFWTSIYPFDLESLENAQKQIAEAAPKLEEVDPTQIAGYASLVRKAIDATKKGDTDEAAKLVEQAVALGAAKDTVDQLLVSYAPATDEPPSDGVTPPSNPPATPEILPPGSDPAEPDAEGSADEIMEEIEGVKSATQKGMENVEKMRQENAEKAASGKEDAPKEPGVLDKVKETGAKAVEAAKQAGDSVATAVADVAETTEEGGLNQIIMYAAGGLGILLLVAFLVQQRRKKKDE